MLFSLVALWCPVPLFYPPVSWISLLMPQHKKEWYLFFFCLYTISVPLNLYLFSLFPTMGCCGTDRVQTEYFVFVLRCIVRGSDSILTWHVLQMVLCVVSGLLFTKLVPFFIFNVSASPSAMISFKLHSYWTHNLNYIFQAKYIVHLESLTFNLR